MTGPTAREIEAATLAVRRASSACRAVQAAIGSDDTIVKSDDSPVTTADFAAQAVVCATLGQALADVPRIVGEEDASDLLDPARAPLVDAICVIVSDALGRRCERDDVIDWVAMGGAGAGPSSRFWTLDPIDGTKGFVRGDQFAIALALVDDGDVVLGVLGCPRLPNADGSVGAVFVAHDGRSVSVGGASTETEQPIRVAAPERLADAVMCESVESAHSDHDQSRQIAAKLGITGEPFRIDSQCKYAAIARGDASIYLRLPTRADYAEKIWDHAAGKFVVECAGGVVTDVDGHPLDFSRGATLSENRGVIATSGHFHDEVVSAVRAVLGTG